jgi:hypothetical protein
MSAALDPVKQFRTKYKYKYTKGYHDMTLPSRECSKGTANSLVKNFTVAKGALNRKETSMSPMGPADAARGHLVTCILHRVITRTRLTGNRKPNLGHEHQLRLLLDHLKYINDTLASMKPRVNTNNGYWRSVEKALAPVVYQTPPGRNSLHPSAANVAKYNKFIMNTKPRSVMINQAATGNTHRPPTRSTTRTTTFTARAGRRAV